MSYTKTTWVTGDTITAAKLNNMESGIETVSGAININSIAFAAMSAAEKCELFDDCIAAMRAGCQVSVEAYGATTIANRFSVTETNGEIVSGNIGFWGISAINSVSSATASAAVVSKANGDVTFSVASCTV